MKITTLKQAKQYGVVTKGNSKIHGSTFSTDPFQCKVGSKLADIENSTCSKCYARKLAKVYPSALKSWKDNLENFRHHLENDNINYWCEAIAYQIKHISNFKSKKGLSGAGFHRWFSSGDLDSVEMLQAICYIAKLTPNIKHWLPTREKAIVRQFKNKLGVIPENLTVRISSTNIDEEIYLMHTEQPTSSVHKEKPAFGVECPAYKTGGSCGDCSMCWDSKVSNISYKLH